MIITIENSGDFITVDFVKAKLLQELKFSADNNLNAILMSYANKYE